MKAPQPNYQFFVEAMQNKKPARMPIYEHHIDPGFIEKVTGDVLIEAEEYISHDDLCSYRWEFADKKEYFHHFVNFWEACGYDTVSFELGIPLSCPGSGALPKGLFCIGSFIACTSRGKSFLHIKYCTPLQRRSQRLTI